MNQIINIEELFHAVKDLNGFKNYSDIIVDRDSEETIRRRDWIAKLKRKVNSLFANSEQTYAPIKRQGETMKAKPIQDRVLVKQAEIVETPKNGIFIPDNAREKPLEGTVVAVGPGKITVEGKQIPVSVKIGDKVVFGKYSGMEIEIKDEKFLILLEEELLLVL